MRMEALNTLCKHVERKAQLRVTSFNDADKLSSILENEKLKISAHTLARLFGVLKDNRKHYKSTLNILAAFIGFESYDEFCAALDVEATGNSWANYQEQTEHYLAKLELLLEMDDLHGLFQCIRELSASQRELHRFKIAYMLGKAGRKFSYNKKFVNSIKEYNEVCQFFSETWVDEDFVFNGYLDFAEEIAGKSYNAFRAFVDVLDTSSSVYSGKRTVLKPITNELMYENAHLLSRCQEVNLLSLGIESDKRTKLYTFIEECLENSKSFSFDEQMWMHGRMLRALAFLGEWKSIANECWFNEFILSQYTSTQNKLSSVGEGIVQAYTLKADVDTHIRFLPMHDVLNEEKNKRGLNALFLSAKASKSEKLVLKGQLELYSKLPTMQWLSGCLH